MIKVLVWTPELLKTVMSELLSDKLHVSDEHRNPDDVADALIPFITGRTKYEAFDVGGGVVIFHNILPGFKCQMWVILWDKKCFTPRGIRGVRQAIQWIADKYGLVKIEAQTSDGQMARIARRVLGLHGEGYRFKTFKRGDTLYDAELLAWERED